MPIPIPKTDEPEAKFISRCSSDNTMKKDYPDQQKRVAICIDSFKKYKGEKMEDIKLDEKGRKIIAENVNIIFTSEIEENSDIEE